jgi:hypothetical protein
MEDRKEANWYYEKDGKQVGPVSLEEIKASIETGFLSYGSMVWERGAPSWVKLENSTLRHLLQGNVPPPGPSKKVNNVIIWILIFLCGITSLLYLAASNQQNIEYRLEYDHKFQQIFIAYLIFHWSAVIAICILPIIDACMIKKKGYSVQRFIWWFWFMPVYLYQRAKSTNQGMNYFYVYMALFVFVPILFIIINLC